MTQDICCRSCNAKLEHTVVDLGMSPFANSLVPFKRANEGETFYPLHVYVCQECFLVQLAQFEDAGNIFSDDYVYFSSYSTSWLAHAKRYCDTMIKRFGLDQSSHVAEVASNDGYLLQNFQQLGMKVTGIEPAANCAAVAREKGIHSEECFFAAESAKEIVLARGQADLMAANNVLAHVPDIHDFVEGFAVMLKPEGVLTFEFPHLLTLLQFTQFDTIYHEHFSYLALGPVQRILKQHGLRVFDVEEWSTHGGSLRVFVCQENAKHVELPTVAAMLEKEQLAGLNSLDTYANFQRKVIDVKNGLWSFLIQAQREGKTVAGYGAAAKGVTLLNYCGVGPDHLQFVVDKATSKQNKLLPGNRIPVYDVDKVFEEKPDYLLILPWNLKNEISEQMAAIREWGGKFVIAIPSLEIF